MANIRTRFIIAAVLPALAASLVAAPRAISATALTAGIRPTTLTLPDGSRRILQTPADLRVSIYAAGLTNARFMALGPRGDVFVGTRFAGTVSVMLNRNGGATASQVVTLLSGLTVPHSVLFHGGRLYVGEEGRVTSWSYDASAVRVANERVVVSNLPTGGLHTTRTISIGPDGMLYVSVGSTCNECVDYTDRAVIMRYRLDGTGGQIYASGLRNAVGLAWQPGMKRLWSDDNGQDLLGDNIPPDEIELIKQGGNYGWPYCYGNGQRDLTVAAVAGYCARTTNPAVALQAHSAPLGLTFYSGKNLPARYRGGMFIAYHGSESRSQATGYKVVFNPVHGARAGTPQDVVTGWLPAGATSSSAAWGRPVGLLVAADGSLLISDDQQGVVYRLAAAK